MDAAEAVQTLRDGVGDLVRGSVQISIACAYRSSSVMRRGGLLLDLLDAAVGLEQELGFRSRGTVMSPTRS